MIVKVKVTMQDDHVVEYFGKKAAWTGKSVKLTLNDDTVITIPGEDYKKVSITNAPASAQ